MRALIMDEDARASYAIGLMLKACGVAVDWAASAQDGLGLAHRFSYDLLLTDVMFPDMCARQLVGRLRHACPNCLILVTSRAAHAQARVIAMEAGADGFIAKPFSRPELCRYIRSLLPSLSQECRATAVSGGASLPAVVTPTASTIHTGQPSRYVERPSKRPDALAA